MNCFHWQNSASDLLDGVLSEDLQQSVQAHLDECKECSERYRHYSLILSTLASQPKKFLPATIRKSPLLLKVPRADFFRMSPTRWEKIPWYLRTLVEGAGIVLLVLVLVSSAPKIKSFYETRFGNSSNDLMDSTILAESEVEAELPLPLAPVSRVDHSDEVAGENDGIEESSVTAGRSELWRFTLHTVTPDELRRQIVQMFHTLEIPSSTEGFSGVQVPGGIEFDLVLPQTLVPRIKQELEKLAPPLPSQMNGQGQNSKDSFSWYRVKSKRHIQDGKSQVVIWLAQPN